MTQDESFCIRIESHSKNQSIAHPLRSPATAWIFPDNLTEQNNTLRKRHCEKDTVKMSAEIRFHVQEFMPFLDSMFKARANKLAFCSSDWGK